MQSKPIRTGLDPNVLARGLGKVKTGPGYARIVARDGGTIAYVKRHRLTVPAALVAKAPRRLGAFTVEGNGRWAGATQTDNDAARAVLEHVVARREEQ
jgi:hypothetical protein